MMKKVILQRLKEIRKCRNDVSPTSPSAPTGNGNHSPGGQTQKVIQWPTNCTQWLHVRAQICMNMCVSVVRSVCVFVCEYAPLGTSWVAVKYLPCQCWLCIRVLQDSEINTHAYTQKRKQIVDLYLTMDHRGLSFSCILSTVLKKNK